VNFVPTPLVIYSKIRYTLPIDTAQVPVSFLVFCLEFYAAHTAVSSTRVYQRFKDSGLFQMLVSDYEDLHGMSFEYLMQFFDEYLGGGE
jgi:hypothetical protein